MTKNLINKVGGIYFMKDDKFVAWCGGCQGFDETVELFNNMPLCASCRKLEWRKNEN